MGRIADEATQILIQGVTGREARISTVESVSYGANVVAGVTPGRGGTSVGGVPVYDSVLEACAAFRIDATLVSVPPGDACDATMEAIAAGVKMIVVTTERMPLSDVARVCEAADEAGVRLIGPNSLGLIVPDQTRIGSVGGTASQARRWYRSGPVAVLSRSGGMMTEIAAMLSHNGLGQSICISVGGDPMIGSNLGDLYLEIADDPETKVVVLFGEPGGSQEEILADVLAERSPVPVVAFVTGGFMDDMGGVRFGHAGTIVHGSVGSPRRKREVLAGAGAMVAARLADVPDLVAKALRGSGG